MKKKNLDKMQEFNKISKKLDKMERRYLSPFFTEAGCLMFNIIPTILGVSLKSLALLIASIPFIGMNVVLFFDIIVTFFNPEKNLFVRHYEKKHNKLFAKYKELGLELGMLYEKDGKVYDSEQLKESFGIQIDNMQNVPKQDIDKLVNKSIKRNQSAQEDLSKNAYQDYIDSLLN